MLNRTIFYKSQTDTKIYKMTNTNGHLIPNIVALPFFLSEVIFLLYVADCPTEFENDLWLLYIINMCWSPLVIEQNYAYARFYYGDKQVLLHVYKILANRSQLFCRYVREWQEVQCTWNILCLHVMMYIIWCVYIHNLWII